jgi:hypothetical protein
MMTAPFHRREFEGRRVSPSEVSRPELATQSAPCVFGRPEHQIGSRLPIVTPDDPAGDM